jgi:hypothetical protein
MLQWFNHFFIVTQSFSRFHQIFLHFIARYRDSPIFLFHNLFLRFPHALQWLGYFEISSIIFCDFFNFFWDFIMRYSDSDIFLLQWLNHFLISLYSNPAIFWYVSFLRSTWVRVICEGESCQGRKRTSCHVDEKNYGQWKRTRYVLP